jgi:hypothetical protein
VPCHGDELVPGEPAPRGNILVDRDLRRREFQKLARLEGVEMLPDEEEQAVAAVEISAVEAGVRGQEVALDVLHDRLLLGHALA